MEDLNAKLTTLSQSKSSLRLKLDELRDAKDLREKGKERHELGKKLREIELAKVTSEIEIENVEELIHEFPPVCKSEEEAVVKRGLVVERNRLKVLLEENFYGEEMEDLYIHKSEVDVFVLTNELMGLQGKSNELNLEMNALGDGEEELEKFKELDEECGVMSARKLLLSGCLIVEAKSRRDRLIEGRRKKKEAEEKERARLQEEEERVVEEERQKQLSKERAEQIKRGGMTRGVPRRERREKREKWEKRERKGGVQECLGWRSIQMMSLVQMKRERKRMTRTRTRTKMTRMRMRMRMMTMMLLMMLLMMRMNE